MYIMAESKLSLYKTTLTLCFVYGIVVVSLIIIAVKYSDIASMYRTMIFTSLGGISLVMLILLYMIIFGYNPTEPRDIKFYTCPDMYLTKNDNIDRNSAGDLTCPENDPDCHVKYSSLICEPDQTIFNGANLNKTVNLRTLKGIRRDTRVEMDKLAVLENIKCNSIDLDALQRFDSLDLSSGGTGKAVRCGIANECGVAWTNLKC